MMRGRIVRVHCTDAAGHRFTKVFDVGLDDDALAISAVRIVHPELARFEMQADERLSPTAVAYLDLRSGEIRERLA